MFKKGDIVRHKSCYERADDWVITNIDKKLKLIEIIKADETPDRMMDLNFFKETFELVKPAPDLLEKAQPKKCGVCGNYGCQWYEMMSEEQKSKINEPKIESLTKWLENVPDRSPQTFLEWIKFTQEIDKRLLNNFDTITTNIECIQTLSETVGNLESRIKKLEAIK
ncbi:MAG TPA: hypothetical protein VMV95_03660 [Bacillota bacterium]|nr:hypothetical protein [Bacillota bacterium]